ncbi:uncharacterized protein LOC117604089 [Osmia lignaria lignaria]|uniref:uncharacterized protein LOC117604089 n=1 Tax=Osmia lignaria lignaria TaxID=1437193 RepID=UPI001478C54A|nr:uncharacterized protein LOC117604089 [Osmia lignaria]XP_034179699.1 uncharacterized protein LOC117604089 [Osmia lignaria]XP_034179700.1 uncharacterized protein LOC117604089 [Osmia lignaria]XP_034179701.1 uncharacterized protein LOC117604089 [Osmia lignaria]
MCTCGPTHECTEEYFTATSDLPSSKYSSWRTPVDRSMQSEFCPPDCPAPSSPRTPKSQSIPPQVPMAPLRTLRRRPELAAGVAIAARRIDFERMRLSGSSLDDTRDDMFDDSDFTGRQPLAASSFRSPSPPAGGTRQSTPGTYRLRRARTPQFPAVSRQQPPRMTQMTPCGKCLRM